MLSLAKTKQHIHTQTYIHIHTYIHTYIQKYYRKSNDSRVQFFVQTEDISYSQYLFGYPSSLLHSHTKRSIYCDNMSPVNVSLCEVADVVFCQILTKFGLSRHILITVAPLLKANELKNEPQQLLNGAEINTSDLGIRIATKTFRFIRQI